MRCQLHPYRAGKYSPARRAKVHHEGPRAGTLSDPIRSLSTLTVPSAPDDSVVTRGGALPDYRGEVRAGVWERAVIAKERHRE